MSKGAAIFDKGADRLQEMADKAASEGGLKAKLAGELAEDAAFLRKLKPSLIAERARGRAPTNAPPGGGPSAPGRPQLGERPGRGGSGKGPNPFVVVGLAFAAGIVIARVIDWRSHAHPRL